MNIYKSLFNNENQILDGVLLLFYSYKTNHSVKLMLKTGVNPAHSLHFLYLTIIQHSQFSSQ